MVKNNKKTYWPHMIIGFLFLALTLSFWTVKSASSIPVQESNNFMLKYQQADININEILAMKQAFDNEYSIDIQDVETMVMEDNIHSNRPKDKQIKLSLGENDFSYIITHKNGKVVKDANVTFLLTRPHSRDDDILVENVTFTNGMNRINELNISKAGRYTLQLRAVIEDKIGYSELAAYLQPKN